MGGVERIWETIHPNHQLEACCMLIYRTLSHFRKAQDQRVERAAHQLQRRAAGASLELSPFCREMELMGPICRGCLLQTMGLFCFAVFFSFFLLPLWTNFSGFRQYGPFRGDMEDEPKLHQIHQGLSFFCTWPLGKANRHGSKSGTPSELPNPH